MDYNKESLKQHKKHQWKLEIKSKVALNNKDDLSIYYTPGVAQPCKEIEKNENLAYEYTRKWNTVAIVSDGSAVLWLWNIGGIAGLPVMEGKAILFKEFWWVNAIPIVLKTQNPDEIINIVENIAPTFGGINLEDIKAPECFYIEESLKEKLNIPVFHDDQHWTAIVVLAGLINALKLTKKEFSKIKIVISGAGAAGIAIGKLLTQYWVWNLVMLDSKWSIYTKREWLNKYKLAISKYNKNQEQWSIQEVIHNADVFIGVSKPDILTAKDIENMNIKPIIFALSNPNPEITPEEAKKWWAFIIATWRSDCPNQVNNLLAFPGIFKWALKYRITKITDQHKIKAAEAIANYVKNPTIEEIIPSALDKNIADIIAEVMKN